MTTLNEIVSAGLCHGCGACVAASRSGNLTMAFDAAGYLRPHGLDSLTPEDEVVSVGACSGLALEHPYGVGPKNHPLWGPLIGVRTGYSIESTIRFSASSGGVVSALVLDILERGEADGVLQVRADPDDPIGNRTVFSQSRLEILAAAGSRYAPSSPLDGLEAVLQAGLRFVFVGKPCDVASLRRLQRTDPRIAQQLVLAVAFICAGVPSRKGTQAVLEALNICESDVVSFAYRGEGWPGFARARLRDGTEHRMDYVRSWGQILNRHLQFRCKICPDGTGEFADVVCADAWYGAEGYPDFAERDGRSLVLSRTPLGEQHVLAAVASGRVAVQPLEIDEIAKMQPYQVTRKRNLVARLLGVALAGGRIPRFQRLGLLKAAGGEHPIRLLRSCAGAFVRTFRARGAR